MKKFYKKNSLTNIMKTWELSKPRKLSESHYCKTLITRQYFHCWFFLTFVRIFSKRPRYLCQKKTDMLLFYLPTLFFCCMIEYFPLKIYIFAGEKMILHVLRFFFCCNVNPLSKRWISLLAKIIGRLLGAA